MLQTRDGYLWLGTALGLVRFDGVRFTNFGTEGTPGAIPAFIMPQSMWEDPAGVLWAGTANQGAMRNDHGHFQTFTSHSGLVDDEVRRIDGDSSGAVWIFTAHGLTRVEGDRFETVNPMKDAGPGVSLIRFEDRRTPDTVHVGLWRETASGVERFAYGKWRYFPTPPGIAKTFYKDIRSIYEDSLHRVWYSLSSLRGTYFCVEEDSTLRTYQGLPPDAFVSYRDTDGYLWLTDHEGHSGRWKDGVRTSLAPVQTPFFLHVSERQDGSFWLSARQSPLFLVRRRAVVTLPTLGTPEIGAVLYRARNGKVWAAGVGLQQLAGGALRQFPLTPPLRDVNFINALGEDAKGRLLLNLRNASPLVRLQGHRRLIDPPFSALSHAVYHLLLDHLGQQWFATEKNLLLVKPDDPPGSVRVSLPEAVKCLFETPSGHLLAGTQNGPLELVGSAFQRLSATAPWTYGAALSMDVDKEGVLWIGTASNGLIVYYQGRYQSFAQKDGLPTNFVGTVQAGDPHAIWLKTDAGLLRIERNSLQRRLTDGQSDLRLSRFSEEDGLPSANLDPYGNEGSLRLSDGTLWFSTVGGIASLQPERMLHPTTAPHTRIEEHVIDRSSLQSDSHIVMRPGQESLEIHYTALGSVAPAELKFRYRLDGIDADWVEARERRVAYYTHLPPGSYRFQVQSAEGDGDRWDVPGASTSLRVIAPWYLTFWFRILVLCLLLFTLLAMLRRRQRREFADKQLRQAFTRRLLASQETERKRIAHDIHDGLGQHLALIANLAQLQHSEPLSPGARDGIDLIQQEVGAALDEVEAISYNLRPYQLDRLGLTNAVLSLVRGLEEATTLQITCDVADIDGAFPKDLEINFYRIVQESLSNIARHSKASSVGIQITCDPSVLRLTIQDNGIGFSSTEAGGTSSLGLVGINERAELLGGSASIESSAGSGTTILVSLSRRLAAEAQFEEEG